MFKAEKGITLVALVITIIVLVILVGVSVSTALNTGLIGNSKNATDKYETEQGLEKNHVNDVEKTVQNIVNEWN